MLGILGPLVVTGTDTGVGKTIVTAAIAAAVVAGGAGGAGGVRARVAVVKPGQTGISGMPAPDADERRPESDVETVVRLAAPATARTLATYPAPLAPLAAARVARLAPLDLAHVTETVRQLSAGHDLTIIEGAGGLLVPIGTHAAGEVWTIADLATDLAAPVVVVVRAGLGTLNHTALTLEALARRGLPTLVVIGEWPAEPELVHRMNVRDLPGELAGVLPERAGRLDPDRFRASARSWLGPALHGDLDPTAFRATAGAEVQHSPSPWHGISESQIAE